MRTRVVEGMGGLAVGIGRFGSEVAQVLQLSLDAVELLLGELPRVVFGLAHQVAQHVDDEVGRRVEARSVHDLLDPPVERAWDLDGDLALAHGVASAAGWTLGQGGRRMAPTPHPHSNDTPKVLPEECSGSPPGTMAT